MNLTICALNISAHFRSGSPRYRVAGLTPELAAGQWLSWSPCETSKARRRDSGSCLLRRLAEDRSQGRNVEGSVQEVSGTAAGPQLHHDETRAQRKNRGHPLKNCRGPSHSQVQSQGSQASLGLTQEPRGAVSPRRATVSTGHLCARPWAEDFTSLIHPGSCPGIVPVLQMRKLRLGEIQSFTQDLKAGGAIRI